MDEQFWDQKYGEQGRLWSGEPNGALIAEAGDLPLGHALDVGCGEGGDAHWLAAQGWTVTGVDLSRVALERARQVCRGQPVELRQQDLTRELPETAAYDLVSVHYFPLLRGQDEAALRGLVEAVAPGGTLLVVGHDLSGHQAHADGVHDPDDYYRPPDFSGFLGAGWTVEVDEVRPRPGAESAEPGHTHDLVFRARRAA